MAVPEVKTKVLRAVLDVIEAIPDALVRSEYLTQAAQRLRVDESVLRGLSASARQGSESAGAAETAILPAEKRLLQILLEDEGIRRQVLAEVREEDFRGLKSEPVFSIMLGSFKKGKDVVFHELQKEIGPVLARVVSQALADKGQPPTSEDAFDCLCALQVSCKEAELRSLQAEIGGLERGGDLGKVEALLRRKQALGRQIMELR